ncbi:type I restriction-modification system subunit M [Methylobacterium sp. Leaf112]|uniref:type I restriction-modification system subunit M n=1 Tax=Methylobacterium sp. Leaf112 TaxID=1736258 RepID=UPI0006FE386C|nr:class I SAM-dependent DNA methyltransferase [Methylobacterium sp. Leaf112]KQP60543.1 restriction endonuclease subunit M [Methylobacterium sp. Leaf112]
MSGTALSSLIWSVAEVLRGPYKPHEYSKVVLPFTVLRRLDCVLAPTKAAVLSEKTAKEGMGMNPEPFMLRAAKQTFVNTSPYDFAKLMGDQDNIRPNLEGYLQAFSPVVRDIFERFRFAETLDRLAKAKLLYRVAEKFAGIDLSLTKISNEQMGHAFEELIRRFAEVSNEKAAEQYTPRDAIELMVNLLFIEDTDVLTPRNPVVRRLYDPTAGTGGMLSMAEEFVHGFNKAARFTMFGQELNDEAYAICKADMLIKGQNVANIVPGDTLKEDGHAGEHFDYMMSNPPYGYDWDDAKDVVEKERRDKGYAGRFGPGLPPKSDGQMLFLLHLVSKMLPAQQGGSRIGIVMSGSPLFTGSAGSGPSEIRRYLLENDLVEAIVALPTEMFFNTGIATYVWLLTNRKPENRRGRVQLIDASGQSEKMRRSLGFKRKRLGETHIKRVTKLFGDFVEARLATITDKDGKTEEKLLLGDAPEPVVPEGGRVRVVPVSRIFRNEAFGYRTITVERPLLGDDGKPVLGQKGKGKGKPVPDTARRDTENVPLGEEVGDYLRREVLPHAPGAWIDGEKTKVGYEIPFSRHFYIFEPHRSLAEIDADLKRTTDRIRAMLDGLAA